MKILTDKTDVIDIILSNFPGVDLNVTDTIETFMDEHTDVILINKDRVNDSILDFTRQPNKHLVYKENPTWLIQLKVIANQLHQEYVNKINDEIIEMRK